MAEFDTERMMRLNGKRPTARDLWTAFWRLYRLADQAEYRNTALDCLRVLGFCDWVEVAGADSGGPWPRTVIPVFLRRRFLALERKRRLYGKYMQHWDEWRHRDQAVARALASEGVEMTPDEVAESRVAILRRFRQYAAEKQIELPANDVDLMQLIKDATGE